ncbi:hypothetical protein QFZ24_008650 [Streptomyces phaeochromogenes]|uniref:DUF5134 domain-containing protein n=1 Tax=Streptomyces phaeochromogenes TaxID=1923 RepID=UPI002791AF8C|nr:DUF5134 domain-containing protein [Streptomyces phaeochromogenes]MDQ0954727.1 hypothetical protein [Streptomyces phaeochromogenes]
MTGPLLGWTLVVLGVGAAGGNLLRMVLVRGWARFEAAAEAVMGGGMAVMAAPPTAGHYGTHSTWWAAVFGAFCLGGVALSVRHAARGGLRYLRHGGHVVIGSAAMVLMTLAMSGTTSSPALALAGSSGHGGMAGMPGMESVGAHGHGGVAELAGSAGGALAWRVAFWALAAYFVIFMALAVRARLRGRGGELPAVADGTRVRHRHARRNPSVLSVPNARLAGHVGMGGSMATMLLMMAA